MSTRIGRKPSPSETVLELIDCIYAATTAPDRWTEFLDRVTALYSGPAVLRVGFGEDVRNHRVLLATIDPAFAQNYMQHYRNVDPFAARDNPGQTPALTIGEAFMPDAEAERTEFYADWLRPQGLKHSLRARVMPCTQETVDLILLRSERGGLFGEQDRSVFLDLMPHLRRAVEISHQLGSLEVRAMASAGAFERLGVGVLLVDSERRVVFSNSAADHLVGTGDCLRIAGGRLLAPPAFHGALSLAIEQATGCGTRMSGRRGATLSIPRTRKGTPLSIAVSPLDERDHVNFVSRPLALVVVNAPELSSLVTEDGLRASYGLTAAEARLVAALCAGETLGSYSLRFGISLNTVKSHLKAVFDKTGESRQADLVRSVIANPVLRLGL